MEIKHQQVGVGSETGDIQMARNHEAVADATVADRLDARARPERRPRTCSSGSTTCPRRSRPAIQSFAGGRDVPRTRGFRPRAARRPGLQLLVFAKFISAVISRSSLARQHPHLEHAQRLNSSGWGGGGSGDVGGGETAQTLPAAAALTRHRRRTRVPAGVRRVPGRPSYSTVAGRLLRVRVPAMLPTEPHGQRQRQRPRVPGRVFPGGPGRF